MILDEPSVNRSIEERSYSRLAQVIPTPRHRASAPLATDANAVHQTTVQMRIHRTVSAGLL
jgi:hypothetical protein